MPIYTIRCRSCNKTEDVFRSVADYDNLPLCCGLVMGRVMSAPRVMGDIQPYRSMATGEMIDGRAAHRNHLKTHGLVEVGNEQPKARVIDNKQQKDSLRREIAARIDSL
jgi:hypothetical protein